MRDLECATALGQKRLEIIKRPEREKQFGNGIQGDQPCPLKARQRGGGNARPGRQHLLCPLVPLSKTTNIARERPREVVRLRQLKAGVILQHFLQKLSNMLE